MKIVRHHRDEASFFFFSSRTWRRMKLMHYDDIMTNLRKFDDKIKCFNALHQKNFVLCIAEQPLFVVKDGAFRVWWKLHELFMSDGFWGFQEKYSPKLL